MQNNKCQSVFWACILETSQNCNALIVFSVGLMIKMKNEFYSFFPMQPSFQSLPFHAILSIRQVQIIEKVWIPFCFVHVQWLHRLQRQGSLVVVCHVSASPAIPCGSSVLPDRCVRSAQNFALRTLLQCLRDVEDSTLSGLQMTMESAMQKGILFGYVSRTHILCVMYSP